MRRTRGQDGFGYRRLAGERRAELANVASMSKTLDGPGSEERLAQIQRRFQTTLNLPRPTDGKLALIFAVTFAATVVLGLAGFELFERFFG